MSDPDETFRKRWCDRRLESLREKLTQAEHLDESYRANTNRIIQLQTVMQQVALIRQQNLEHGIQERDQRIQELEVLAVDPCAVLVKISVCHHHYFDSSDTIEYAH